MNAPIFLVCLFFVIQVKLGSAQNGLCPDGKKNGEEWDDMSKNSPFGKIGTRKYCFANATYYKVSDLACITVGGTRIPIGENRTEILTEACTGHYLCNGEDLFQLNWSCDYSKVTTESTVVTTPSTKPTTPSTKATAKPAECEGGKKEGEEWDVQKTQDHPKFRKRCVIQPEQGYCVITVGCYSILDNFIERGKNVTESQGNCDYVSYCIAVNETATDFKFKDYCGANTLLPRSTPSTVSTTPSTMVTTPSTKPTTPSTEPTTPSTKATTKPVECPGGKKNGEQWDVMNKDSPIGKMGIRKSCFSNETYYKVSDIACITVGGTRIPVGKNRTEKDYRIECNRNEDRKLELGYSFTLSEQ